LRFLVDSGRLEILVPVLFWLEVFSSLANFKVYNELCRKKKQEGTTMALKILPH
jgi:hypothetical protein